MSVFDRFWSKVDVRGPGDCWPWQASLDTSGYGCVRIAGRLLKAHRVSAMLKLGVLDGVVCHSCDNRRCINPAHLWLGTAADNIRDRDNKGRQARHRRGNGAPRIPLSLVPELRAEAASGTSYRSLARKHGVSWACIQYNIERRAAA